MTRRYTAGKTLTKKNPGRTSEKWYANVKTRQRPLTCSMTRRLGVGHSTAGGRNERRGKRGGRNRKREKGREEK